jgi:hypothetical protein
MPPTGTFTIFDGSMQLTSTLGQAGPGVIYPAPNSPYVWVTFSGNLNFTLPGPAGPHTLTLNYSGDANYAPSTSGPFPVTEVYPTQLTLTPSATTIVNGQPLTLTAQIVPSQNAGAAPSGSVAFSLNSNPFRTVPVTNGQAQITLTSLSPTAAFISATYSGDSDYGSSSASITETVTFVSTNVLVTPSSPTSPQNTAVTFTAQIIPSSMGAAPVSGTVYFTANGIEFGNMVVSNSQAQATTSFLTPGSVQIQASYSGDGNYTASAGTFAETVTPPPDFSVTASGTTTQTVNAGQTATFTNALTVAALNGFNSQVNLSCSLPFAASGTTCTVNPSMFASGNGTATAMVTTTSRGVAPPYGPNGRINLRLEYVPLTLLPLLLAALLLNLVDTRRQRLVGALRVAVFTLFLSLQAIGCGGGSSGPPPPPPPTGTPAGTYTIIVNGNSTSMSHSSTLTLVVN